MPLYFTDRKKRWPPSKPVQYLLAILALLAAVAILIAWLFLRFVYISPADGNDTSQDHSDVNNELPDDAYCLVVIEDVGYERFALVHLAPRETRVSVTPLAPSLTVDGSTLAYLLQKQGASKVAATVANALNIPLTHYVAFSIADAENLFVKLGENLTFPIPETVTYKDENNAVVRLNAEKQSLTPKQIAALLHYRDWENSLYGETLAADLIVSLINQCLYPQRSLKGYFELLSNTAATDLRIDQFNAYRTGLEHLAAENKGALAKTLPVISDIS